MCNNEKNVKAAIAEENVSKLFTHQVSNQQPSDSDSSARTIAPRKL